MRKCKCVVLERISNGDTTFLNGDFVMVQFYKLIDTCDVWEININKKMLGVVTGVSKLKVQKFVNGKAELSERECLKINKIVENAIKLQK